MIEALAALVPLGIDFRGLGRGAVRCQQWSGGHRWGGDVFTLAAEHISAMDDGQVLVLDVMNEYAVFLKSEPK